MTSTKPRLAFVSPVFLFPNDAGGKIRTTNILRGLKGGAFDVTLVGAAPPDARRWQAELGGICDRFVAWPQVPPQPRWRRAAGLLDDLPVNVLADRNPCARAVVGRVIRELEPDVAVFDFVHAAVLRPAGLTAGTVCFTHNVEADIFARHEAQASNPLLRCMWASQRHKMERFERNVLRGFDAVVAVSERDAGRFRQRYGIEHVSTIPTGVDLDYFSWCEPAEPEAQRPPTVVFTGSMDWDANVDGVRHFLGEIWPRVKSAVPEARFMVVGRNPPAALVQSSERLPDVHFTGFVDDVRPYVHSAQAFVIPLRVGGGTRIKAFEAMSMGCPVVSTTIGIEGLDVRSEEHFLCRDDADAFAASVALLLRDGPLRRRLSVNARKLVSDRFGHLAAAQVFEQACLQVLANRCGRAAAQTNFDS